MKLDSLRVAVTLTAALTTAVSPLLVSAQTAYEYKAFKQGLVVTGAATAPAPGPVTPPPSNPQPALQLSTNAINFGDVATNATETRQVLVSNPGTGSLSFTAAPTVSGDVAFAAGLTTCGATLAAGADCLTDATFSPTEVGTYNGVLRVTSALANSPHEVTLAGTAFNPVSLAEAALPLARLNTAYSPFSMDSLLRVSNEPSPQLNLATWQAQSGLPPGMQLSPQGVLSGTPTEMTSDTGTPFTVLATYKRNQGQRVYVLRVGAQVLEVISIGAGLNSTCAVTTSGQVKCWGSNTYGKLGIAASTASSSVPVTVGGISSGATSVTVGYNHACAIVSGGVYCWGYNAAYQLGNNSTVNRSTATAVSGLNSGVVKIDAGMDHTCALASDTAYCWGLNGNYQAGDGASTAAVRVPRAVITAVDVAAGDYHSCVVQSSGKAFCWGVQSSGRLGNGSTSTVSLGSPTQVVGVSNAVAIAMGNSHTAAHSCVRTSAGGAQCWGGNNAGQLGVGDTTLRSQATSVVGLAGPVRSLALGTDNTCAILDSGSVQCWGEGANGELGRGANTADALYPVTVAGLPADISEMALGHTNVCAISPAEGAFCWGGNVSGQVGDGTVSERRVPTRVVP